MSEAVLIGLLAGCTFAVGLHVGYTMRRERELSMPEATMIEPEPAPAEIWPDRVLCGDCRTMYEPAEHEQPARGWICPECLQARLGEGRLMRRILQEERA